MPVLINERALLNCAKPHAFFDLRPCNLALSCSPFSVSNDNDVVRIHRKPTDDLYRLCFTQLLRLLIGDFPVTQRDNLCGTLSCRRPAIGDTSLPGWFFGLTHAPINIMGRAASQELVNWLIRCLFHGTGRWVRPMARLETAPSQAPRSRRWALWRFPRPMSRPAPPRMLSSGLNGARQDGRGASIGGADKRRLGDRTSAFCGPLVAACWALPGGCPVRGWHQGTDLATWVADWTGCVVDLAAARSIGRLGGLAPAPRPRAGPGHRRPIVPARSTPTPNDQGASRQTAPSASGSTGRTNALPVPVTPVNHGGMLRRVCPYLCTVMRR